VKSLFDEGEVDPGLMIEELGPPDPGVAVHGFFRATTSADLPSTVNRTGRSRGNRNVYRRRVGLRGAGGLDVTLEKTQSIASRSTRRLEAISMINLTGGPNAIYRALTPPAKHGRNWHDQTAIACFDSDSRCSAPRADARVSGGEQTRNKSDTSSAARDAALMPASERVYIGTYTSEGKSRGIYMMNLDTATGTLSKPDWPSRASARHSCHFAESEVSLCGQRGDTFNGQKGAASAPSPSTTSQGSDPPDQAQRRARALSCERR